MTLAISNSISLPDHPSGFRPSNTSANLTTPMAAFSGRPATDRLPEKSLYGKIFAT